MQFTHDHQTTEMYHTVHFSFNPSGGLCVCLMCICYKECYIYTSALLLYLFKFV